ncbi:MULTISPECIES: extracellular solute-binding protein [unclassified Paenibacillus]|uniref:extracellular solute-binding protein n=1 Tax=unclassified Paenibacillus TaxID=185978 RepID=UPI0009574A2B|nr:MULTISPECIES: extracellular solute-binding protein [unclassified Paenibacillus]ASS67379.1 extracellular solute-binding protein [Paenibacillus sp. RUD330]SIQ79407.1 putative aldouronate transport system substrate-binding protein [Paenibacillus sp. RU4X]SIR00862.1 putative aldouronate transport system substrate-binding protein [Paenibacillus sp. RU4T]
MKTRRLQAAAGLCAAALLLGLTACSSDKGEASKAKAEGAEGAAREAADFNETGYPIAKSPIKLKMFAQRAPLNGPYKDMLFFQDYAKKTGIEVQWEDVPAEGFAERKNLLLSSDELPDALYKAAITPLEAVKYGSSGLLVPLEQLIDRHAPNLKALLEKNPEILASIKAPDGHIYALPAVIELPAARTDKAWLNTAWLRKLNLREPSTTDELVRVLTAFRDGDPNGNGKKDEIPMTELDQAAVISSLAGSWGLDYQLGYNLNIKDGKVDSWLDDQAYKDYLGFLNKLYAEKLLDPEVFSQKPTQYYAKMAAAQAGYLHNQAGDPFGEKKDEYAGIAPLSGPAGIRTVWAKPVARDFGTFAVTSADKHPDATIRWIDYFYGEEGSTLFRYGIEGQTFSFKADGLPEYNESIRTDKRGMGTAIGQFTSWPGGGAPQLLIEKNASAVNPPSVQEAQKKLDPYLPKAIYGAPLLDEKTNKELDTLRQDLDAYVAESTAKFITGALPLDKWDEYAKTLKGLGLPRLEEIYQNAFDNTQSH